MCKALDLSDCVLREKGEYFFTDLFFFLIVCLFEYTGIYELVNKSFFYEIFGGGLACLFALVVRLLIFQKTV